MALRKLGLPGSQSVMIGDTPYDAEAGLEAGTKAAGVLTGASPLRCFQKPAVSPWRKI
jgi:phosphoglycolate phosphatase-like HAD superfamily hydrolase